MERYFLGETNMGLEDLSKKIDSMSDLKNEDELSNLIHVCNFSLETATGTAQVDLLYLKSNAFAGIYGSKNNSDYSWSWEQPELIQQLFSLRSAAQNPHFDEVPAVRRLQIFTNLANTLNNIGRFVDAISVWAAALEVTPKSAMAAGNLAYGITTYSQQLYDTCHQPIFLNVARQYYELALAGDAVWDSGQDVNAKTIFETKYDEIKCHLEAIGFCYDFDFEGFSLGDTVAEQNYRKWCLQNKLFLNPLNDCTTTKIAAHDVLHLPSHVYAFEEEAKFPTYFNQLKQEFISARYRLYNSISGFDEKHYSDNDVLLFNNFDYAIWGYTMDEMRISFKLSYGILDKIAGFINEYYKINLPVKRVGLRSIWAHKEKLRSEFVGNKNWPLRGLYYLSKDLFDRQFSDLASPDAKNIDKVRNRLEHGFVTIQEMNSRPQSSDNHIYISHQDFQNKTLKILRLAREALINLSLAMHREESLRKEREVSKGNNIYLEVQAIPM